MKKKPEEFSRRIEGVVLRKSDLREIAALWNPPDSGYEVNIETDLHTFNDVEELISFNEPITLFRMVRRREHSYAFQYFSLRSDAATITVQQAGNDDIGMGSRICDLLLARRRWFRFSGLLAAQITGVGLVVGALLVSGLFADLLTYRLFKGLSSALLGVLLAVGLIVGATALRGNAIRFRPEPGESKPINWRSATWQVALLVIGGVLTLIGASAKERLWPKGAAPAAAAEARK